MFKQFMFTYFYGMDFIQKLGYEIQSSCEVSVTYSLTYAVSLADIVLNVHSVSLNRVLPMCFMAFEFEQ